MAEVQSEPVVSQPPGEPAPEVAQNAQAPKAVPPQKPAVDRQAQADFAQAYSEQDYFKQRANGRGKSVEDLVPDEPGPSLPPLQSEQDKLMFGLPTMRPAEPVATGVNAARPNSLPVPADVLAAVPLLMKVARRPDAPPEVLQMLTAIAREMH